MKVKTFRGQSIASVLGQVKREFGKDAVIINTRTMTTAGILGLGKKPYVEITAARQLQDLPSSLGRGRVPSRLGPAARAEGAANVVMPARDRARGLPSDKLLSELGSLKSLVGELVRETRQARATDVPSALFDTYQRLVEKEVADHIAQELIKQVRSRLPDDLLHDPAAVRAELASTLESMLPTAGPIRAARAGEPTVIALIGPTGVGKTTTIAKLAANFCLREHLKVGLITIDTYRIAAIEQLKTYAQIIDVPLDVAATPDQLRQGVARMADRDIILIDTAGRSQRDVLKINELRNFFRVVRPDEIHLVLSSTCRPTVLSDTIERFRDFDIDRIILTKLDEAIGFGVILSCLSQANARLSYVTTGQDVPDDIEVGRGAALAAMILGEPDAVSAAGSSSL